MKRIFWMVLIFTFLFSLTCLFAQENVSVAKSDKESKVTIQKVGKKVSEMPQVTVKQEAKKSTAKISREEQVLPRISSKSKKAIKTVQKKPSVKKQNVQWTKKPKALPKNVNQVSN